MTTFATSKRLPNELIREIVLLTDRKSELPPNASLSEFYQTRTDLLNLCLTCRLFRQLTLEALYSDIRIDGIDRMHRVLLSICRNRPLRMYVRFLQLTWTDKVDRHIKRGNRNLRYRISKKKVSNPVLFSELEDIYQVALKYGLGSFVTDYVKARSEGATAIVLLRSLPNLTACTLEPPYTEQPPLPNRVVIPLPFDDAGTLVGGRFLGKLQVIRYQEVGMRGSTSLRKLLDFFFLPSIRTVITEGVYIADAFSLPEEWCGRSSMQTLHLRNCNIYVPTFSQLLQMAGSLKSIIYERDKVGGSGGSTNREDVIKSLSAVSNTLEHLLLTWYRNMAVFNLDDGTIGSLVHFKSLKRLTVDVEDFLGRSPHASIPLSHVLPPNLEELLLGKNSFAREWRPSDYVSCLRELLLTKVKTGSFHKLKKIGAPSPFLLGEMSQLNTLAQEASVTFGIFELVFTRDGTLQENFEPMGSGNIFTPDNSINVSFGSFRIDK